MRSEYDFYPTPPDIIESLIEHESFKGEVWEPACGDGRIVDAFQERGVTAFGTDIQTGDDFLKSNARATNIVTNPPFNIATEFVHHALRLADQKVAMLLRLQFLAGIERYDKIWRYYPLKSLYVFSNRIQFGMKGSPVDDHAWFVWEKKVSRPNTHQANQQSDARKTKKATDTVFGEIQ